MISFLLATAALATGTCSYPWTHPRFIEVQLVDATDCHEELYFEREYLLLPNEAPITNAAPVVFIEDSVSGEGYAYLRLGPCRTRVRTSPRTTCLIRCIAV